MGMSFIEQCPSSRAKRKLMLVLSSYQFEIKRTQRWSGTITAADPIGSSHAPPGKRCYRGLRPIGGRST